MRRLLTALLAVGLTAAAYAQDDMTEPSVFTDVRSNAVFLELGGVSEGIGVNYESRFGRNGHWGWRAGLGFAYAKDWDSFFGGTSQSTRAWVAPLGMSYLVGNLRNALELGFGVTPGIYNEHYVEHIIVQVNEAEAVQSGDWFMIDDRFYKVESSGRSHTFFGYFIFTDIAYRHVSRRGFLFKAGVQPVFSLGDKNGVDGLWLLPHLDFGWAF